MKKSVLLSIIGVLLVIGVGITFAYFSSGVEVSGSGSTVELQPGDMIKVTYDAGDSSLNSTNLIPGDTVSKSFTVTVTPTETEKTAVYAIYLDLTNNTFVKCDDSNYNSITNACIKDYEELTYTIKDGDNVLATGDLTGKTGKVKLLTETKTVDSETTFTYTLEITFHETNADQNHNMEKSLIGNVVVEFSTPLAKDIILAQEGGAEAIKAKGTPDFSQTATTDEGMYAAEDDNGTTYYYRGAVNDNWFEFGTNSSGQPLYWRIVRINGDGSIRLIYNGTSTSSTDESTMINTSQAFNTSNNNNAYVGYMYKSGEVHGLTTNSSIKTTLDDWYIDNLKDEYAEYLDGNAGFYGDRYPSTSSSSSNGSGGTGTTETYYGAYIRLYTNKSPSFKCTDKDNDLYTTPGSSKGNGALKVTPGENNSTPTPIGLITADEVSFAGGVSNKTNSSYYLYNNANYWTMSPYNFNGSYARVFVVNDYGNLDYWSVYYTYGVRPVINLKSAVAITGSGTADNPFKVES